MQQVGYRLVATGEQTEVHAWRGDMPNPLLLPNGDQVCAPSINVDYSGWTLVPWEEEPKPPETIADWRFWTALALIPNAPITRDEARDAINLGTIPPALQNAINQLPFDDTTKFVIERRIAGSVEFNRTHALTAQLAALMGWTAEQVDGLWATAASL